MKKFLVLIILTLTSSFLMAQEQEIFKQALELKSKGQAAQAQELFQKASRAWEELGKNNPNNGDLWFNAGNAAYLAKDFGRSTLFWKKALDLSPWDSSIRRNWELGQGDLPQDLRAPGSLSFFHTALMTSVLVIVSLIFGSVFLVFMGLRLFYHHRGIHFITIISLVIAGMFTIGLGLQTITKPQEAVVFTPVKLLRGDSLAYEAIRAEDLKPGTLVQILEDRMGFTRIRLGANQEGWVGSSTLEKTIP